MHVRSVFAALVYGLLMLLAHSSRADEDAFVQLSDSVRPFASDARVLGESDPAVTIHVQVALRMRNLATLEKLSQQHWRVSSAVLDSTYLPEPARYTAICAWLTANGLIIDQTHSSRLSIDVEGSVSQISHLFRLHFSNIMAEGHPYISANSAPSVPAAFADAILGVNRLQPQLRPRKLIVRRTPTISSAATPGPPFTPIYINRAYAANRLDTTGQRSITAVIIDTFPLTSDLTAYWKRVNVPQSLSNISFIQTASGSTSPPTGEETLDTEVASAFAPSGKVRVYGSADLNYVDDSFEQLITDMQSGVAVTQVSMSFGDCESETGLGEIHTEHQYFVTIAAMGASLFAASGDGGIYGCDDPNQVEPLYPASDPAVTGVGATSLSFSSSDDVSQTGWSCNGSFTSCDEGSSGGGLSTVFATPNYQSGIAVATHRAVPDISVVGDPDTGLLIVFNGKVEQDGGTSVGAPLMAAYVGLINDARLAAGKPALGSLNRRLYQIRSPNSFTDITSGNNGDMAGTGYDLVTGIGTPVMSILLQTLAKQQ